MACKIEPHVATMAAFKWHLKWHKPAAADNVTIEKLTNIKKHWVARIGMHSTESANTWSSSVFIVTI